MYTEVLHICLCAASVLGANRGYRREVEPLELELHIVVSCHMGARN